MPSVLVSLPQGEFWALTDAARAQGISEAQLARAVVRWFLTTVDGRRWMQDVLPYVGRAQGRKNEPRVEGPF